VGVRPSGPSGAGGSRHGRDQRAAPFADEGEAEAERPDGDELEVDYPGGRVTNPRTGAVHKGWTPILLDTLRQLGVTPDFVVYHRYEQAPGGESDLLTVFMPTGIVPPAGFICFVPRSSVVFLSMSVEEAAKIILSGGIVMPDIEKLKRLGGGATPASLFGVSRGKRS